MAHVTVTIAGKHYRMACSDGEEKHLEGLALMLDNKVAELRKAFGEIGEMRLHVMASLVIADELSEARRRLAQLERDVNDAQHQAGDGSVRLRATEARVAEAVAHAAERIEHVAKMLNPPPAA